MYLSVLRELADDDGRAAIAEALEPPNRINSVTGLPYGWDETTELEGLDGLITR